MTDSMDNEYPEIDDEIDLDPEDEVDAPDELAMDVEPVPDPDRPAGPIASGPAEVGVPDYADDDSDAEAEREIGREADGPAPAAMPLDREDPTVGLETSAEDERRGDTIDDRIEQEEPDVGERP